MDRAVPRDAQCPPPRWALVLIGLCLTLQARADTVRIDPDDRSLSLGAAVIAIPERDAAFAPAAVLAGVHDAERLPPGDAVPNIGYPRHPYWAVIDLRYDGAKPIERLLVLWRGKAHRQRAYMRTTAASDGAQGPITESAAADVATRHSAIRLDLEPGSTSRVAVHLDTDTSLALDYRLIDAAELARADRTGYWSFGLFAGVLLSIAIYILALYLALREHLYLVFAGFALFNLAYQLHTEAYAYELWPDGWRAYGNMVSTYCGISFVILLIQFVRDYMGTRRRQPLLDRYAMVPMMWLCTSVFPLFLVAPWLGNTMAALSMLAATFAASAVVLRGSLRERHPVWSFVAGILFMFVSGSAYILRRAGALPDNELLAMLLQVGSAVMVILFAFAVTERVSRIAAEKRRVQQRYATRLELEVRERTAELSEARDRAEIALTHLREAQNQLVQSEKMASLGQLVAGVAHEVNTPIGVALTASTFLEQRTHAVHAQLGSGALAKSQLDGFLDEAEETAAIIERNLGRAARLVSTFKQVSVDRTSDGQRRFDLAAQLHDLIESLQLTWKHRPLTLALHCPAAIELESYPGALGQVLSNLIRNSLMHAFEPGQSGTMTIAVRELDSDRIELRYSDDGHGVAPAALGNLFEPFYTTMRGQGGTGLGLHIAFNLVTQKLGGDIRAENSPSAGLVITIRLPRKVASALER